MIAIATSDRRTRRREETKAEILEAAWELARTEGLAGVSLRELAARVGMRAPSLYSYFDSKNALYDAMFAQGSRELLELQRRFDLPSDPVAAIKYAMHGFMDFCQENLPRYQLLLQRTIPGFEPSPGSFAISVEGLRNAQQLLERAGLRGRRALDLWTALATGLTSQQISNDAGGDRWTRLIDEAVDMFVGYLKGKGRKR
jgi:AcrR family transcriptional regulator